MNGVKWIKITVDMFDNRKIRHLRKLPEGDAIVLIWVMLLCMAGKCNAGGRIYLTETIAYTPKLLADELNFEESTVTLALRAMQEFGMIDVSNNGLITVQGWAEYQNIDGMDRIREQNRIRKQKQRERQQALPEICHVTSRDGHATDKEGEVDKDKIKYIVDLLNETAGTHYKTSTGKTKTLIRSRLSEGFTKDDFKTVIEKKCREWKGTEMEQYLRPETLFGTKFEGYLNSRVNPSKPKGNGNNAQQFTQRSYADRTDDNDWLINIDL